MSRFIIIGSGDHARVIQEELMLKKKFYGFVDKNKEKLKPHLRKYYLGNYEFLKLNKNSKYKFLIGAGRGDIRKKILNYIEKNKIILNWGIFISPNSNVMKSVKLNEGVVILKNSVINNNCIIGKHCHFNTRSVIEHDNKFDDFSGTGPGVITGGNVRVGKETYIGLGCKVKNGVKITSQSIIGIGSVVTKNLTKKGIYYGSPARFKREKKKNENYFT
jgi:acetyltransferase EpsM